MSRVKNENFIAIQGWMVNELGLKGNELIVYACIYGFSQDGEQWFSGSLQYLVDWTNSYKSTVTRTLKSLVDKGLIVKKDVIVNGVKFCEYRVQNEYGVSAKCSQGISKIGMGCEQNEYGGVSKIGTNNILDNIDNNILDNIDNTYKDTPVSGKPLKHKYGEYKHVLLSDIEKDKLFNDYGEQETLAAIKHLDEYLEMTGKKYKSHYLVMKKWVYDAVKETQKKQEKQEPKKTEFDEWMEA